MLMRRGPRILGAAAVGGTAYVAGRRAANRSATEQAQSQDIADLQAQQDALAQQQAMAAQPPQTMAAQPAQAVAAQPAAAAPTEPDRIAQLERLGQLKESGVLTDDEFANEKQRILSGG